MRRVALRRRTPIAPQSARRRAVRSARAAVAAQVFARDGGCVLSGGRWGRFPACFGRLTVHHVRKASQGGSYTAANLVALCVHHNDAVEDWPAEAHALGLVVKSWEAS